MITQRSTYQAENWTSNTKKTHLVIPQSYFRYEPISLSYDPNEFAHFYNKKSHQNFANFDRPEKGRINEFFNFFFEIGYSSTRSCQQQRQKTKKAKNICEKKIVSKIAKSEKIASICCFLPLKIEEKLKKNRHCLAVRTEIRTGNVFILPRSWIFAVFISLQNASKKRLGSCPTPGSTTWALPVIFAQNSVFWTFKKLKKGD